MTTKTQYEKNKNNSDYMTKERERINNLNKKRYAIDPEFRERIKANVKARRERIKEEKLLNR